MSSVLDLLTSPASSNISSAAPPHLGRAQGMEFITCDQAVPPFQYLLLSVLALMIVLPYVPQSHAGTAAYVISVCALLVTGVLAASVTPRRRLHALALAVSTILCTGGSLLVPAPGLTLTAMLTFLAFHVYVTSSRIHTLLEHQGVQLNTLYGAAAVYLLVGHSFSILYVVLEQVLPPALAVDQARLGHAHVTPADIVFFSFMTLTTVGYGDITPVSPEARLVAQFESVAGAFFPAFLVARLVALYRAGED